MLPPPSGQSPASQEERPDGNEVSPSRQPLAAIGAIIILMLSIPLLLYPIVPEDTLKAGHVVFASGKHTVHLQTPGKYQHYGFSNSCVLETNAPLVIVEPAQALSDGMLVVKTKEETSQVEFPFCPPQAKVLVHQHQIIKKRNLWSLFKDFLSGLLPS